MPGHRILFALVVGYVIAPLGAQPQAPSRAAMPSPIQQFQGWTPSTFDDALRSLSPAASMLVAPGLAAFRVDSLQAPRRTCPMPVMTPDTTRFPVISRSRRDSLLQDPMPTVAPRCENPLHR